jgi:ADP-ribose pyrophosphatase
MTLQWYPLAEAARKVLSGEVVNAIAVAGILAAHAVTTGFAQPRPVDSPWQDKPSAFAARKAAQ